MASAWTENGPISLPPRSVAFGVGGALVLLAFVGIGLGLKAAWKDTGAPDLNGATTAGADSADTLTAKPIVELPAPPAASNTAENTADEASARNGTDDIEQKAAEAQQVQSTASKSGADIDQILASPTEKPTAPAKPTTIEAPPPPGPPVKSDVPF
ncbi:MAG: hypothetical protein ACREEB_15695 [Caulobacteraceae bacterium]